MIPSLPNTERLTERRDRWVAAATTGRPLFVEHASGVRIRDVDGREFLDFVGGVGTANHGHSNPDIVAAIREQLDQYLHQCFSLNSYLPYIEVCELLTKCHPGDFEKKALLLNSGAEAVENAIKIARAATGRTGVICLDNAFHGRTLLTMSLTAKVNPYKLNFGPFAPEIYRATGPYPFRGVSSDDAIDGLHRLFKNQQDPSNIAAIIFEPVQGEGGIIPMPADYPGRVAEIAAEHGILVIADEVQSGMGRTGPPAAISHYGVEPDLITWGKSLGGGLPISGVTGRAELMDSVHQGGIGGTYGGNPLSCAAAKVAITQVLEPGFRAAAAEIGDTLRTALEELATVTPSIGEVRGIGPMLALEVVNDRESREPAPHTATAVINAAFDRGLLLMGAGIHSNCIRILVPLTASEQDISEGLSTLRASFEDIAS